MKICGRIFEITNEEIVSVNNNMTTIMKLSISSWQDW